MEIASAYLFETSFTYELKNITKKKKVYQSLSRRESARKKFLNTTVRRTFEVLFETEVIYVYHVAIRMIHRKFGVFYSSLTA